jgi:hypothetical protein
MLCLPIFEGAGELPVGAGVVPLIDSCRKNSSSRHEKCSQKPRDLHLFSAHQFDFLSQEIETRNPLSAAWKPALL